MKTMKTLAAGATAALALGASGCEALLMGVNGGGNTGDPGARRAGVLGTSAIADEKQDALELAVRGDSFRDAAKPDYVNAHIAYRAALNLEPRNGYVLVAQATAYLREASEAKFSDPSGGPTKDPAKIGDADRAFKRARNLAERALTVNKNYGTAHFVLAEILALQGLNDEALKKFAFIKDNNLVPEGHGSTFHAWIGFVKEQSGDKEGAKAELEEAVNLSEPVDIAEYAERVLRPPPGQQGPALKPAVVKAN